MLEFFLAFLVGCFAGVMTGLMGASGMMAVVPGMILLGYTPYQAIGVTVDEFEGPRYRRVSHIQELMASGRLSENLRWLEAVPA